MSGWIKLEKDLPGSIRFRRMLKKYGESQNVTVTDVTVTLMLGALVRYWFYVDTHVGEDNSFDGTLDDIDDLVSVPGFARSLPPEWLVQVDEKTLAAPGFLEHNGSSASERRRAAIRQNKSRAKRKLSQPVTESHAIDQTRPDQKKDIHTPRARDEQRDHDGFLAFKSKYPAFAGRANWLTAEAHYRNRLEHGATNEELLAAAERYRAYVEAGAVSSTAHVLRPDTFLSAGDEPWRQSWEPPQALARPNPKAQHAAAEKAERDRARIADLAKIMRIEQGADDWTKFSQRVLEANDRRLAARATA